MTTMTAHSADVTSPDPDELLTADIDERIERIEGFLCHELVRSLDVPADFRVDTRKSLHAHGVGSILALRLKGIIESSLRIEIEVVRILQAQSVAELAAICALRITGPPPHVDGVDLPCVDGRR